MPTYDFRCTGCNKVYEIRMKLSEHAEQKDKLTCQECHDKLEQCVAPMKFKLLGTGWFDMGYDLTDTERKANLEDEKRIEEHGQTAMLNDKKRKEF